MARFNNQQVIGWMSMSLSQKKYAKGRLYISGIAESGKLTGIDIRFFMEEEGGLMPTKKGFRVRSESFPAFMKCLNKKPQQLGECVIWQGKMRRLIIRYCDDQFGEGIDCRYWVEKDKYTGWEKRGLRLSLADFQLIKDAILRIDPFGVKPVTLPNLFTERKIMPTAKKTVSKSDQEQRLADHTYINDRILEILSEE